MLLKTGSNGKAIRNDCLGGGSESADTCQRGEHNKRCDILKTKHASNISLFLGPFLPRIFYRTPLQHWHKTTKVTRHLQSELPEYRADPVALRSASPVHLCWAQDEVLAPRRTCQVLPRAAGHLPRIPHTALLLLLTTESSPKCQAVPGLGDPSMAFLPPWNPLLLPPTLLPQTTLIHPSGHRLPAPPSSRLLWYPQEDVFTISWALPPPYLLQNTITAFAQNNKGLSLPTCILTIQTSAIYICKNICPQISMYLEEPL